MKDVFDSYNYPILESGVHEDEISLQNFTITRESRLANKTIRDSGIREVGKGLVVGFERNGQRNLNPESTVVLTEGDIVWIVGVRKKLNDFFKN